MSKTAKLQFYLTIFAVVLLLISITAGTFAWFSFRTDTNVESISGTVGQTEGSLLISNSLDGPFDTTCELKANVPGTGLIPISTGDLSNFYTAAMQNTEGDVIRFRAAEPGPNAITGTVYLKATKNSCDVFFSKNTLNFGTDNQVLAALRLGLRITRPGENPLHLIFKLDDLGNSAAAAEGSTLPDGYNGRVAAGTELENMAADPARNLSGYWATKIAVEPEDDSTNDEKHEIDSVEGKTPLFRMEVTEEETVARVDYFVYLEGCDIHCHNLAGGVSNRDLALGLGFYAEKVEIQ